MSIFMLDGEEEEKQYILVKPKMEPDGKTPLAPEDALSLINKVLSRCSGQQLCIIAEQLDALKHALDRYERPE
ncbi:MAG: hypothetical protein E7478_09410 [Ruminococcaceae bacterium]|nr:hypothetical protein [Oscillospiraceae bacterium]